MTELEASINNCRRLNNTLFFTTYSLSTPSTNHRPQKRVLRQLPEPAFRKTGSAHQEQSRCGGRGVSFVCFRSARRDWGCRGNLWPEFV